MTDKKTSASFNFLYNKRLVLMLAALVWVTATQAQLREINRSNHDDLPYYFGIYLAYNSTSLHPDKSTKFIQDDSVLTAEPGATGGVALGFLATFKIAEHWEFRLNPNLIIGGAKPFTYTLKNPALGESLLQKKSLPSSIFTFPAQIKFNSDRIDNFRVYMLFDAYVASDLMANAGNRNAEDLIKLKKNDFGLETGIGFNFYLRFVTLSPELKFSYGLSNLHARDPNLKYSSVFDKLQSRMITFSINIEQ